MATNAAGDNRRPLLPRKRRLDEEQEIPPVEIPPELNTAITGATDRWFPSAAPPAMDVEDGAAGPARPPDPLLGVPAPPAAPPAPVAVGPDYFPNKARADGIHDFGAGNGPKREDPNGQAFNDGVIGSTLQLNEDTAMDATFGIAPGPGVGHIRQTWESIPDNTSTPLPTVQTGHQYSVKKVPFKLADETWNVGRQLIADLGIDTNTAVLQIDFNHHGFLQKLTQGGAPAAAGAVQIGYVWSAATVNDPASKTPPTDRIFAGQHQNGVTLVAHQQTAGATCFKKETATYYSPADPTANFVSEYDVELSGIIQKVLLGGRRGKDSVALKFTNGANVASIDDSKGQNSPNALVEFITKLLGRPLTAKSKFDISSKWQQKRSGDWFQAIHAAMLPKLALNPGLPENAVPFFVSHDGIAISYALEMGVNCLFFSGDQIYAFTRGGASTAEQQALCQVAIDTTARDEFDSVLTWFGNISARKKQRADILYGNCRGAIARIDAFIATASAGGAAGAGPVRQVINDLATSIQGVFRAAVRYVFVEKLLPDATILLRDLGSENPCVQVNAYRTLQRLYAQHDRVAEIPETILGSIDRSATGKAVKEWKIEQTLVSRLVDRLAGDVENRDAYIFLPYIQNSTDATLKNEIAGVFQRLQTWLQAVGNLEPIFQENPGPNRQKRIRMALNGLSSQVSIFLKTTRATVAETAADDARFRISLADIPDDPTDAAPGGAVANVLSTDEVIESYIFRQTEIDEAKPEAEPEPEAKKARGMTGGWRDNQQFFRTFGIDSHQCVEPVLYAIIENNMNPLRAFLARLAIAADAQPLERLGGRRPLYGGKSVSGPAKEDAAITQSARDVIYAYTLIGLTRVLRDVGKLRGAPTDVLEYYTRGTAFMLLLLQLPITSENALAVYDLMAHSAFMNNEDIAKALSLDVDTAGVYRLFFSALEENLPTTPPSNPAEYLIQANDTFASMWHSIPDVEPNATNVELIALEGIKMIRKSYGLEKV
jgi:hypothetical protein